MSSFLLPDVTTAETSSPTATRSGSRTAVRKGKRIGIEVSVAGLRVSLTSWHRSGPRLHQTVFRRFVPELDMGSADLEQLERRISAELPRNVADQGLPTVVTLPIEAAIYAVQQAKAPAGAVRAAASEMVEGQVDYWPLNAESYSTYTCPGPIARSIVKAVRRAGYNCAEVIAHPLALRYAARLAGHDAAAVLDWGWGECVLAVPVGAHGSFSRKLSDIGLATVVKRMSGVDVPEPMSTLESLLLKLRPAESQRRALDSIRCGWEPTLRLATTQIKQSLMYAGRFTAKPPSRILLCGMGSMCDFIVPWLNELLDLPVERWSMPAMTCDNAPWAVSAAAALMPEDLDCW